MDKETFNEYRTGQTHPGESNRGLVTVLLICVIFLTGLSSVMGLLNIRLFNQLNDQPSPDKPPLSFSKDDAATNPATDIGPTITVMQMTLLALSNMDCQIYNLPEGLYVCHMEQSSPAVTVGIEVGDVLIAIDDTAVTSLAQAESLLSQLPVQLTLYRDGKTFTVTLDNPIS